MTALISGSVASVGSSVQAVDLLVLAPALVTALGALMVLLVDVLRPTAGGEARARPAPWLAWLTGAVLVAAAAPLAVISVRPRPATFCLPGDPGACSYDTSGPTLPLQWLVLAAGVLVVALGAGEVLRRRLPSGEYHFLLLSSITGALVVLASRDLATTVVALETVTLPAVALVGLLRDVRTGQAALTLYLSSVVSLAVSLYGVALLYTATGTLHYSRLADALGAPDARTPVAELGAILVLGVFVFKVAAVPFQAWAPDTYAGAPVPLAAYLSVISKTAGLGALAVLLSEALLPLARSWGLALAVVVLATFVVGNVLSLRQASLVRLLAWSSVAQIGYVLLPLAAVGAGSTGVTAAAMTDAVSASVVYLLAYAVMTLASWAAVMVVVRRLRPRDGVLLIADVRGLARRSPWLGGSLLFAFTALAGLPPGVIGLVVKVRVFQSAIASQSWLLVGVAVAATVVGLAYYLRVAAILVSEPAPVPVAAGAELSYTESEPLGATVTVAVTTLVLVATSAAPALLLALA